MRVFTKMIKPPFATFRKQGFISVIFVDDSYLQGQTMGECLSSLRFTIQKEKLVLEPTQYMEFLRFIINSVDMTIKINPKKSQMVIEN